MSVKGTVGTSRFTQTKYKVFNEILCKQLEVVYEIHKRYPRWNKQYLYLDLNAGDGQSNFGLDGSPLNFLSVINQFKDINCSGKFVEIDPTSCSMLKTAVTSRLLVSPESELVYIPNQKKPVLCNNWNLHNINVSIFNMSNDKFLQLPQDSILDVNRAGVCFGLIYSDPNNGDTPIVGLTELLSHPEFKYLDILINRNCTAAKRVNGVYPNRRETLFEITEKLPKNFWFVREPETQHQFSLILGTNSKKLPRFKHLGFYNIKSKIGKLLMNSLSYSKKTIYSIPIKSKKTKQSDVCKISKKETPVGILCGSVLEDLDKLPVFENLIDEFSTSSKNKLDVLINIVKKDIPEDLDKLSVFENLIDEFSTSSKNKLDILINMVKKPDKKIPLTSEIQNVVTTKNLSGEPVKPTTSYSSIGISLLDDPETFNSISEILYKNSNKEIHKLNNSGNCWSKSQTAMIVYQTYLIQHCSCGLHEISVKRLAEIAGVGITYMKGAKIISLKVPDLTSEIICGKTSIAKAHKEYLNAVGRCCSC